MRKPNSTSTLEYFNKFCVRPTASHSAPAGHSRAPRMRARGQGGAGCLLEGLRRHEHVYDGDPGALDDLPSRDDGEKEG